MGKCINKGENMIEKSLLMVLYNIGLSTISILSTLWGKFMVLILFIGAYFASIAGMIHIIIALVLVDAVFGITVSVRTKGVGSILSYRLRNTVFKMFFYLFFLVFTFLIEFQITGAECLTPKVVFAVIGGVELWSISANALILHPKFPFLRLFKKYLVNEISKKLDMSADEVKDLLDNDEKDKQDIE